MMLAVVYTVPQWYPEGTPAGVWTGWMGGKRLKAANHEEAVRLTPKCNFALGFKSPASVQSGKRIILSTKKV